MKCGKNFVWSLLVCNARVKNKKKQKTKNLHMFNVFEEWRRV